MGVLLSGFKYEHVYTVAGSDSGGCGCCPTLCGDPGRRSSALDQGPHRRSFLRVRQQPRPRPH